MIKFFRKIRQRLLQENRVSKYLVYAVGEIVLVVIGILIALQINNWNENRKDRVKEKHYISNLIRDVKNQIKSIKEHKTFEEKVINQIGLVLTKVKKNNGFSNTNEQLKELQNLVPIITFKVYASTFSDLQSSGNMSLISNKDLSDKINQYYIELLNFRVVTNENSNDANKYIMEPLMDFSQFITANMELPDTFDSQVILEQARKRYKVKESTIKIYDQTALLNLKDPQIGLRIINAINFKETISIFGIERLKERLKESEQILEALERHANTLN